MTTLDIRNYADVELTSLYQWDEHRTIRIHGITIAENVVYKLHFSNRRSFASLVVVPTEDEGVFVAEIPIQMLQRPCAIAVYLYGENTESNERMTLGEATITVVPRAMPEDEVEQHEDGLLAVPDGFVMKDGKLYLARGGMEFGEGATVGGGDRVSVYDAMSGTQVAVGSTVILDPYEEHFSCDTGYYFDSEVEATLNGNLRKKSNSIPAIGIVVYSSVGYSFPVFISPVPQGTYINVSEASVGTVTYDAITWYWTKEEGGVSGNRSDSSGNMQKYPTTCGWNDSIRSIPSSDVLAILEYVHARKEIE